MNNRVYSGAYGVINKGWSLASIGKLVYVHHRLHPVIRNDRLVYVIGDRDFHANVNDGVIWQVESLGTPFVLSTHDRQVQGTIAPCRDSWLAPVHSNLNGVDQMLMKAGYPPPVPVKRRS